MREGRDIVSAGIVNEIGLLGLLLIVSALFSEGFKRMGQSTLIGELLVGILLGPSLLGWLHPTPTFDLFMEMGLLLLLVETGLETQWRSIVKVGSKATLVAIAGIVLPWVAGTGFALLNGLSTLASTMIGATLTATSIGITARTLSDLNRLESDESQIILGAAVLDDILGLGVLAVMQGLAMAPSDAAQGNPMHWMLSTVGILLLGGLIFLWLRYQNIESQLPTTIKETFKTFGARLLKIADGTTKEQMIVVGAVLLFCWAVQSFLGISMALGAFAFGLLLKEREELPEFKMVLRDVEAFASIMTPLFFIGVGMQLDVRQLNPFDPAQVKYFILALVLTVIAIMTKALAGFAVRDKHLNSAFIGMGMVPRGEVGLIFVQVGKVSGLLSEVWANILIVVVILTTLLAPLMLKRIAQQSH
jgi:Kef-type K+ transport system membrane component KefB